MKTLSEIFTNYEGSPNFCDGPILGVHHKGIFGNTPLHIAAIQDDPESAKVLIEAGADITALGEDNLTPLMAVLELGKNRVAEYLREVEGKMLGIQ